MQGTDRVIEVVCNSEMRAGLMKAQIERIPTSAPGVDGIFFVKSIKWTDEGYERELDRWHLTVVITTTPKG